MCKGKHKINLHIVCYFPRNTLAVCLFLLNVHTARYEKAKANIKAKATHIPSFTLGTTLLIQFTILAILLVNLSRLCDIFPFFYFTLANRVPSHKHIFIIRL